MVKVSESLKAAKKELDRPNKPNLPLVANYLSQAERSLIALYPERILAHKAGLVVEELKEVAPEQGRLIDDLESRIQAAREGRTPEATRHVLQDARRKLDEVEAEVLIQEELQEARLSRAWWYLIGALLIILVAVPITTEIKKVNDHVVWPVLYAPQVLRDGRLNDIMFLVLGAIGLALVGATGGILSGMFSVRNSRAKLNDYRTSTLNVGLRPLIGATAAICVCLFLTWGTINGIEVTSKGTFAIAAFLAGFSERYFLRFLHGQESAALEQIERDAPQTSRPQG
ncbi:hypothetical protein [Kribbella sp. NPDC050459]|uniref:hypothetical protein n=1 Tax=Kribbella sp. NPDC050459 TaxID=3155785 RepID=UPI0034002151